MRFELYRRDGHSKHIVLKAESLAEVAKKAAVKAGLRKPTQQPARADGGPEKGGDG